MSSGTTVPIAEQATNSWISSLNVIGSGSSSNSPPTGNIVGSGVTTETMAAVVESVRRTINNNAVPTTATATAAKSIVATETATDDVLATTTATTMANVADLSASLQHFGFVDYFVFILMLVVCAIIGFYFGFIEKNKKKKNLAERRGSEALDYLVGGRKMKVFPVSLSLVASFISGISLLGTSTEVYVYGTQYAFVLISLAISGVISWYVFLPVFCNLQLTSTYEYFEMRFDKNIRLLGSILFTVATIVWLPIVIYVPALAFNQVTGVNIHVVTPCVCIVCIFYTCVGGLKAVVWTDVIQTVIMIGAIILLNIKGTMNVGGLDVVWQRNFDSGRIEAPALTWDITERVSVLSIFVGGTLFFTQSTAGNQVIVQRYLAVPTIKQARNALIGFTVGVILLMLCCFYNGMLIVATYYDCDPLTTKLAKAKDQLVPLLVMDTLSVYPGIPGLFVAGVFSAALSSLSTGLNSLSAVFLEDYIKPIRKTVLTEFQIAVIMRLSVVLIGVLCMALVFVVELMGAHVLQLSVSLSSITSGPLLGLFMMGLLLPWINSKSAFTGSILAFVVMSWICIRGQLAIATGELVFTSKPVSVEGCTYTFESVITSAANQTIIETGSKSFLQYIYQMSFLYYVIVGASFTIIFAFMASQFFGRNDPSKMNIELFAPCIRRFIKPIEYVSVLPDEKTVIDVQIPYKS